MKHLAYKLFLIAILSLTFITLMVDIPAIRASTPITEYLNPYPPPTTPEASSDLFRSYFPVVSNEFYWSGFEDFSYYLASGNNLYFLGRRRAEAMRRKNYPNEGLAILNFGCAYGDNLVKSYEYDFENEQYKIISLGTVKNRVKIIFKVITVLPVQIQFSLP